MRKTSILSMAIAASALIAVPCSQPAHAAPPSNQIEGEVGHLDREEVREQTAETRELLDEAVLVARELTTDAEMQEILRQAKGVFIVPDFGKGALGVGVRGGEGVLLARSDTGWSAPAFYDLGGISLGAQVGGAAGEMALVLMSDEALDHFKTDTSFSLNADADFTIVDYSAVTQASIGRDDVIVWSDNEGAFIGAGFSVTGISWDEEENRAFYSPTVTAEQVLEGRTMSDEGDVLRRELPS